MLRNPSHKWNYVVQKNDIQHLVFSGNIIEIFNDNTQDRLKILFKPECIQTDVNRREEFRLGDNVDVYCALQIKAVKPVLGATEKG